MELLGLQAALCQARQLEPGLFLEFCNFIINDLSTLLFDGLLELEEIRDFEMLQLNPSEWSQLD